MSRKTILILWDVSHIWGLMAYRAIRSLGIPCRLIKALEISQGSVLGKPDLEDQNILLVPGGNARLKAQALGVAGMKNIRRFVAEGGFYLGFCGGAGLALSEGPSSLGLCPMRRARFEKRFYHFLSGHIKASLENASTLSLPIWWPGRFDGNASSSFSILARYHSPGSDLWLADLPLAKLPPALLLDWTKKRGLDPKLGFPEGDPLILHGGYGKGEYLLSYAHLETPDSAQANAWLCDLLNKHAKIPTKCRNVPKWHTLRKNKQAGNEWIRRINVIHNKIRSLTLNGLELGLLFKRKEWLLGWQSGFSGMAFNNLLATLSFICENYISMPELSFRNELDKISGVFLKEAEEWLWTYKLDGALHSSHNHEEEAMKKQLEIFGHPMLGGGIVEKILSMLDEYIWAYQDNEKLNSFLLTKFN